MSAADDLRALSEAATPGPWTVNPDASHYLAPHVYYGGGMGGLRCGGLHDHSDAELIVWLRNHADTIADLIDAAKALAEPAGWWTGVEQRQEHQLLDRRAVVRDALAALEATDGPH